MSDKRIRVEGVDHLYRTPEGTIVNTNKDAYSAYIRKRAVSKVEGSNIR